MNRLFLKRIIILLLFNKKRLYKEHFFHLVKEALKNNVFSAYSEVEQDIKPYVEIIQLFVDSYIKGGDFISYKSLLSKEAIIVLEEIIEEEKYLEKSDKVISKSDEDYLTKYLKMYYTEQLMDSFLLEMNKNDNIKNNINYDKLTEYISNYYSKILHANSGDNELKLEEETLPFLQQLINNIGVTENVSTTGFPHLDEYLINKGIDAGEICIFAAPPGWGKSVTLLNVFLKNLEIGKNTVLISLENSISITLIRMLANMLNMSQNDLKKNKDLAFKQLQEFLTIVNKNKCIPILKHFESGTSIEEIEEYLRSLNPKPDTIIIDYLGEIRPPAYMRKEQHRLQVAEITRSLRRIGDNLGAAVFTASQLNREGQMFIEKADQTNIANSWDQVAIADLLIIFRQNTEDAVSNTLRLYIAKNRIGMDSKEIICKINYEKAQIYSVGSIDIPKVTSKKEKNSNEFDVSDWSFS